MLNANVRKALQAVKVRSIPGLLLRRLGNPQGDGGYVVSDKFLHRSFRNKGDLFSFGIGGESSFELDAAPFFRSIMMFDIVDCELPEKKPNMFFTSGVGFSAESLRSFKIPPQSMLKFDVEGAEWEHIEQCLDDGLFNNFTQIVAEFHFFHVMKVPETALSPYFTCVYQDFYDSVNEAVFEGYAKVMASLQEQYYCFHIHANNSLPYSQVGGLRFPPLLELSFVKKTEVQGAIISDTKQYFPVMRYDVRNKADRPDFRDVYPLYKGEEIC